MPQPFKPPAWLSSEKYRLRWFFIFVFLFSIQVLPRVWRDSALPDEAWETTTGYYYWLIGDVSRPFNQPPLANALQAFPLLFLNPAVDPQMAAKTEDRAYSFFYVTNLDKLDWLIALPRLVVSAFALGIGWLLYRLVRKEKAPVFYFTLLFWAFEPTLLTYAVIAKTDIPLTFFCLAALLLFLRGQKEFLGKWDFLAGALSGMAVTSKLSALSLGPLFLVMDCWEAWKKPAFRKRLAVRWLLGLAGFVLWVFLIYLPATIKRPGHRWPFSYVWLELEEQIWAARNLGHEFWTFFLGKWWPSEPLWHLPVIFVLKSALPFVLLLGVGLFVLAKTKSPAWMWVFPWGWITLLVSTPTVLLRYALPAYPVLILTAAQGAGWLWQKGGSSKWRVFRPLLLLLGAWGVVSVASHFPNQISYFNDLVPPDKKETLLASTYYDLDQDLKRLGQTAQDRHWTHIKLAYVGQDDPYYYGLPIWEPWTVKDLQGPQPGTTYVIQKGFLRKRRAGDETKFPIGESWAAQAEPTGSVGETWVYFEVPGGWKGSDKSPVLPSTPYLLYQNAPYRKAAQP